MSEDMRQEIGGLKTDMGEVKSRLTVVETTVRNIAIVVAYHTEAFGRIEKQLTKLDELDGLKNSLEVFTSEIIASRPQAVIIPAGSPV